MKENIGDIDGLNRRKLLQGAAGATSALITGMGTTGSVAATDDLEEELSTLFNRYDSREALRESIETHAGDLLRELSQSSASEQLDTSSLPLGNRLSPDEFGESKAGVKVTAVVQGGKPTARIVVNYPVGGMVHQLYVLPEINQSYTVSKNLGADSSESWTIAETTSEGIETQEATPQVSSYKECQRQYMAPSQYICNDVWTQCWGVVTGCKIKDADHGDCGTDCDTGLCEEHCEHV